MASKKWFSTSIGILVAVCPAAAMAQAQVSEVEEIVVTARARQERLQEIPIAITAFSAESIEKTGIRNFSDVAAASPGIKFLSVADGRGIGRAGSSLTIRGISANGATSLFVDGVYAAVGANSLGLDDLERVEIIKGPQSAFFGRNTFAGAVNFITKKPSLDEYQTSLNLSAGTFATYTTSATETGPIIKDKLGFLANVHYYSRGATYRATDGGGLGEQSSKSVSGVLYAEPSDKMHIKFRAFYDFDDDGPAPGSLVNSASMGQPGVPNCLGQQVQGLDINGNPVTVTLGTYLCGTVPNPGQPGAPKISSNTSLFPSILAQVRQGTNSFNGTILPLAARPDYLVQLFINNTPITKIPTMDRLGFKRSIARFALTADYEFLDGYVATVTAGYNRYGQNQLSDYDQTDLEAWYVGIGQRVIDRSVEARVVSRQTERLRGVIGGTYYNQAVTNNGNGMSVSTCFTLDCVQGPRFNNGITTTTKSPTWSIYGAISFDIFPNLTLDVEGRYLVDKRTTTLTAGAGVTTNLVSTFKQKAPRVILTYKPTTQTTLYIQGSQGSLPGTVNNAVAVCNPNAFRVAYTSPVNGQSSTASECDQYKLVLGSLLVTTPNQYLKGIEAGWKQTALNNALFFNLAGYYYKWDGRPSTQIVSLFLNAVNNPGTPQPTPTANGVTVGGNESLWGAELEAGYTIDKNWQVGGNVSWGRDRIGSFVSTTYNAIFKYPNFKGKERTGYPRWMGALNATYTSDNFGDWRWYARADAQYSGKFFADPPNLATISGYTIVNAGVGVERGEGLRVELWVRNLFQQRNWVQGGLINDFTIRGNFNVFNFAAVSLAPQDPRTFGIRTNIKF